jgi:hypothetical protein
MQDEERNEGEALFPPKKVRDVTPSQKNKENITSSEQKTKKKGREREKGSKSKKTSFSGVVLLPLSVVETVCGFCR